jgi:hypothetical protein
MTVSIPFTEFNQRLAALVRNSASVNQIYITSKATFWRLVGFGILAFGIGVAAGTGFYGYGYVRGTSDSLTMLSSAFSEALSEVKIKASAEGTVRVEPHEILLAKEQIINFDSNSRLLLDPDAKIRADEQIEIQTPSISVPQNVAPQLPSRVPTITNFTVFKRVPFQNGVIMTGWNFLTSNQKTPSNQYCYYSENADTSGLNVVLDIADDERMDAPKTVPQGFDMLAAFNRCVWFKSEAP